MTKRQREGWRRRRTASEKEGEREGRRAKNGSDEERRAKNGNNGERRARRTRARAKASHQRRRGERIVRREKVKCSV